MHHPAITCNYTPIITLLQIQLHCNYNYLYFILPFNFFIFQAHQGNVSIMQELIEGSVIICDERIPEINLQNIILTYGEDYKLVVWKVSVFSGSSHHSMEVSY